MPSSHLSRTEARLLRFLLERSERLVGREELLNGVWGDEGKDTLRIQYRRLGDKPLEPDRTSATNHCYNIS